MSGRGEAEDVRAIRTMWDLGGKDDGVAREWLLDKARDLPEINQDCLPDTMQQALDERDIVPGYGSDPDGYLAWTARKMRRDHRRDPDSDTVFWDRLAGWVGSHAGESPSGAHYEAGVLRTGNCDEPASYSSAMAVAQAYVAARQQRP